MTRVSGNEIHNQSAYDRGIRNAIKRNAATRRSREWLAVPGNSRLSDWLNQTGEFRSTCSCGRTSRVHLAVSAETAAAATPAWCPAGAF